MAGRREWRLVGGVRIAVLVLPPDARIALAADRWPVSPSWPADEAYVEAMSKPPAMRKAQLLIGPHRWFARRFLPDDSA